MQESALKHSPIRPVNTGDTYVRHTVQPKQQRSPNTLLIPSVEQPYHQRYARRCYGTLTHATACIKGLENSSKRSLFRVRW